MVDFYGGGNSTQIAFWHPVPTYRGTYNILSACLITIGLCVWSALHLNIPKYGEASRQWRKKVKWLFVGLFAPELVAWTAFRQHRAARKLYISMREKLGQDTPTGFGHRLASIFRSGKGRRDPFSSKPQGKRSLWTMKHSHYAVMGGFAIVPGEKNSFGYHRFLPAYFKPLTITPDGLEFLANLDIELVPNTSESEIRDKSNANGLGKALVCIQAFWFCIQCVTRLCQGLEISLLELNAFAHAICALLMYLLWWDKPLDIEEPTLIESDEKLPAIALLCMASEFCYKRKCNNRCDSDTIYLEPILVNGPNREDPSNEPKTPVGDFTLNDSQDLFRFRIPSHECRIMDRSDYNMGYQETVYAKDKIRLHLSRGEVRCLELASQAIGCYGITTFNFNNKDGILQKYIPDFPKLSGLSIESSFNAASLKFLLGFSLAGCVYGGLHLSAWNAPFPATSQRYLWHLSGLVLISSGPVMILRLGVEHLTKKWGVWDNSTECYCCLVTCPIALSWYIALLLGYGIYILARVYLVVECFVMLWHLPDGVYNVPSWTQYLPYIG